jgi:hypothetical protein
MKKVIAALALSVASVQANAWGPVEQAALAAIAGGFLIGRATAEPAPVPPPVYYGPPVVQYAPPPPPVVSYRSQYYAPPPRRQCYNVALYDAYGRYVRSTRQCQYAY